MVISRKHPSDECEFSESTRDCNSSRTVCTRRPVQRRNRSRTHRAGTDSWPTKDQAGPTSAGSWRPIEGPAGSAEQDSPAQEPEQDALGSRQQTVTQVLLAHRPAQELELDAPNSKGHKQVCPSTRQEQDSPAQELEQDALGSRQRTVTQALQAYR